MKATTTTTPKRAGYNTRGESKMVSFRMPLKTLERLNQLAGARNASKTQVMIDAIERFEK